MKEKLQELIKGYEIRLEAVRNTSSYNDVEEGRKFAREDMLEEVIDDLKKLL